jgi:hypothetical protein
MHFNATKCYIFCIKKTLYFYQLHETILNEVQNNLTHTLAVAYLIIYNGQPMSTKSANSWILH